VYFLQSFAKGILAKKSANHSFTDILEGLWLLPGAGMGFGYYIMNLNHK
jgi:hypothetical protein